MQQWNSHFKDYYEILQVHKNAEEEVITAAYYALMKKYHPDVNSNENNDFVKSINEAYEVLSHPQKKENYFKEYLKKQRNKQIIIKEVPTESYVSKRSLLNNKEQELKEKEELLKKQEISIKIKNKLLKEMSSYFQNSDSNIKVMEIDQLIKDFVKAKESEIDIYLKKINELKKERIYIIKSILKNKISLRKEIKLYEILLSIDDDKVHSLLKGAFKYKVLYEKLFSYILKNNLNEYKGKISSILNHFELHMGENYKLLMIFMDIYKQLFSKEENLEFLVKIQKIIEKEKDMNEEDKKIILIKFLIMIDFFNFKTFFKKFIKKIEKKEEQFFKEILSEYQ